MSINPPLFNKVSSLALYELSSSSDSGVPGYWAGYLPGSRASFGDTATLDQVWQDIGGVYLFLNQTPADYAAFLDNLNAFLPVIAPAGTVRFLWISNPNDPWASWQYNFLLATASAGPPVSWTVARQAIIPLGSYALQINSSASLTQAPAELGYGIAIDSPFVTFLSPNGSYAAVSRSAWMPLAGPSVGAWMATLLLPVDGRTDGFTALGVQLRYAVPAISDQNDNSVRAIPMPILSQGSAPVTLYLSFDPLNLLTKVRTQLGFFSTGSAPSLPAFNARLVTTLGYGTTLRPINPAAPLWAARFLFCSSPILTTGQPGQHSDYYLAPDGAFSLAAMSPPTVENQITLGLSALEYVGLPASSGAVILFRAGQPAYAPNAMLRPVTNGERLDSPLLTNLATTSYAAFLPPAAGATGLTYFAQPRQAPLYVAGADLGAGFMGYHQMPAATLPSYMPGGTAPATFPVGVYSGLDPMLTSYARVLEQAALAPARRAAVGLPVEPDSILSENAPAIAVTPQGLVATLSSDRTQWAGVVIANLKNSPQLSFAPVGPAFQAALQSNELFFVVSNVETFMSSSSVSYRLGPATLSLLPAAGVPVSVVAALKILLEGMRYPVFSNETAFVEVIQGVAAGYVNLILPIAGLLKVDLDGWIFQLSPRSWRGLNKPTVMIFKYCNRSLEDMAADASAWGWPQAAEDSSGDLKPTQTLIQAIFAAAAQAQATTPYGRFYREVVRNPFWNGVLFLNAPVSMQELPAELQFAAAGINLSEFYAHHVGLSLTPFDASTDTIKLGQTAVFGLIDYQDPDDLYLSETIPFAFKTLAFTARFANAALADFSAQVELMVNRLFGAELTKKNPNRGNNLVMNGGFQRQNGAPSYAFTLQGENVYSAARSALSGIEILGVQIQTATSTQTAGDMSVDFIFTGNLRFVELPIFDLFSYGSQMVYPAGAQPSDGYLRFGNLAVNMLFPLSAPSDQSFLPTEGRISFDLGNSKSRPLSLAQNFPVRVSGFIAGPNLGESGDLPEGQRPEDLGFTTVAAPITQSLLSPPWYGLVFTLDLGTLGALAGSVGLSMTLLAGWATGLAGEEPPVFLGLQLPDSKSLGLNLPVQGVLRLSFRSFQFQASGDESQRSYMLRLRRLALSILGWSFPPGNTDVFLFGNNQGDAKAALGWYAAYSAADDNKDDPDAGAIPARKSTARRLQSGRRALPPGRGV